MKNIVIADSVPILQNGLAKMPPIGWRNCYSFGKNYGSHVTEQLLKTIADDIVVNGMKEIGDKKVQDYGDQKVRAKPLKGESVAVIL